MWIDFKTYNLQKIKAINLIRMALFMFF